MIPPTSCTISIFGTRATTRRRNGKAIFSIRCKSILTCYRPVDQERINLDGGAPAEDEPFDYDAVPTRFFFDVETVGGLDPDQIVGRGIKGLQEKLAQVIHELAGSGGPDADFGGAQSPPMDGAYGNDVGYTTPGYGGGASSWGGNAGIGGGTTPYGATPGYGGQDKPGW
jgi:DNA-directed RNA polymerase II subunit RPB3